MRRAARVGRARLGGSHGHAAGGEQAGDAVLALRGAARRAARPRAGAAAALPGLRLHEAGAAALRAARGLREFCKDATVYYSIVCILTCFVICVCFVYITYSRHPARCIFFTAKHMNLYT